LARLGQKRLIRLVRLSLPVLVLMVVASGPVLQIARGSICTISLGLITLTCPLGFIQTSLASSSIVLGLVVPTATIVAATILLGRVFCGWICPAGNVMQHFGDVGRSRYLPGLRLTSFFQQNSTRIVLLGSTLVASAVLRYPVFCVVCPVGIICRNVISLVHYGSIGLDLLLIPGIVALELVLAPWCAHICPLGTTLSVLSRKSTIVPVIDKAKCVVCSICTKVCSLKVSLIHSRALEDCSKCLECSVRCPTNAIEWRKRAES